MNPVRNYTIPGSRIDISNRVDPTPAYSEEKPQGGRCRIGVSAVIASAGVGRRLPAFIEKPYLLVGDKPILAHTLLAFEKFNAVNEVVAVVSEAAKDYFQKEIVAKYKLEKVKKVVGGGRTRSISVHNGLKQVSEENKIVVIHDGVRPFVSELMVNESIEAVLKYGAAAVAVPVVSTVKRVSGEMFVEQTLNRRDLMLIQTPQTFKRELILKAYEKMEKEDLKVTDDAALLELINHPVKVIMGSYNNIKITTPEDLILARAILDNLSLE